MAKKRHTPEQVINKGGEVEVAIAEGNTTLWATGRRCLRPFCLTILSPRLPD